MAENENDEQGIDERLEELASAMDDAHERCHHAAAVRLARELKRRSRAENRLLPYIRAIFNLTNMSTSMLDPEMGREAAVELIAVLESEERARRIQSNYSELEYEAAVAHYSSCAYDNLATATARINGYNSDGVHSGISEGMQVCRRTGKLECLTCFREYATDVFRAADDLDMAMHHARHVAHGDARPAFDRRWVGASDEARLFLDQGRLEAAEAAVRRALELCAPYHSPLDARLKSLGVLETIRVLKGGEGESFCPQETATSFPAGEYPQHELDLSLREALVSSVRGDHEGAIAHLKAWDRRLLDRQCLEPWFALRLRLIAAHRLAERRETALALARELDEKARKARDWLTLRLLARVLDPAEPASPIPTTAPLSSGPFAPANAGSISTVLPSVEPATGSKDASSQPSTTPLETELDALQERLQDSGEDPAARASILDLLLSYSTTNTTNPTDVAHLMFLAMMLGAESERASEVWDWAQALAAPFDCEARVLSYLATLGDSLREASDPALADQIRTEHIESLFRSSLDLDANEVGNFGRAGTYYLGAGKVDEAERCFARGFRLDRGNKYLAQQLAQIYGQTDRARDALAVFDMCLREGCDDPEIAWEASTAAHRLEQYEVMLTYLDKLDALLPEQAWVNYYRGSGLLHLDRPVDALTALSEEARVNPDCPLPVMVLRACAWSALGDVDRFREQLATILAVKLSEVDYFTHNGLVNLFTRLWSALSPLADDDSLRRDFEDRLLATGLAPNELFDLARNETPTIKGLQFYRCTLRQPLGETWGESDACLNGEQGWTSYQTVWGVLAKSDDEAAREALAWQARCYPLPATVEEVALQDSDYEDHPGVVWQGFREGEPA